MKNMWMLLHGSMSRPSPGASSGRPRRPLRRAANERAQPARSASTVPRLAFSTRSIPARKSMLKPLQSPLHVVLVSPRIPPNTGNVARLCAVTGCKLVLVEPLGFSIADRDLKRAGLDYWDKVFVQCFPGYGAYLEAFPEARRVLFSARAER